ncbi:exodeoxyribonuclease V subunit gamma [Desulfopila sp. IMCC35006]|uniref:exodeoxyribonuclease V subunit gamma n=1 Tax=Desulfopila sp. IMCC35006 TaxID=2569542 RepID=UPI0010ACE43A|nr:exodeoxyribonuclease V subunit gamma [Desulfopila sp. IMCC35006]TKB25767.1 exodeoxyribonuclease V subunit gamma [Desulfopila sp. IMCC35006]
MAEVVVVPSAGLLSMFYLHVSNRTENLLRHMAEVILADKQANLFATELFLIQSQGMERMVGQSLADVFRSFCNFKFFLPLDFLTFVADRLGLAISPDGFQRQILTWRVDGLLRDLSGAQYQPLLGYLAGENSELKRFQLARRLANIFDQYQIMRPEMLRAWERGVQVAAQPAEEWQMDLWRRLLAQSGGEVHRGMQFTQVVDRLDRARDLGDCLPKRVSVIGLHTFPPMYLNYLNSLASHMDVHLFLLSPCRNYWGNVQSRRTQFRDRISKNGDVRALAGVQEEHHPLLASLGSQGRDLQNMMLENARFALEFASYDDPLAGKEYAAGTLLQRLQADLLDGFLPVGAHAAAPVPGDDSIQVVSCHAKLREITVLKDQLLHLLHQDGSLELRDIIVMAPDIQEYAPLIPAVFADIQHSIADRSLRRRNAVLAAFLSFLDLFMGRFGWSELLDLLRRPVIFPQFQLNAEDLEMLQQWVTAAGIRWGLSGAQRGEAGLPEFAETSWQAGLERMLMGFAIDSYDFVDGVLPFTDIEGKGASALGGLCQFVEVVTKARLDFQQTRLLGEWSEKLQHIVQQLFGEEYEQELMELRSLIAELSGPITLFHSERVGFTVIREWFNQSAKESRSSSGFLRGQLTFCSMLPMRSIPFKVVCLIGLCDGVFPKTDRYDTFDLMGTDFRPGDRSPRADDRYQFLEALLAARSHLYLSYIGQSIKTNEEIPPSVVVTEFLEVLENGYGVKDIVVRHPLHPFSSRYFDQQSDWKMFSYDSYYCKTAAALRQGAPPPAAWWQGRRDETSDTVIFSDLLRFYANPQKFFIKDCLGIRLDTGEDLPDDREMFAVTGLDKYAVEEEMVRLALAGTAGDVCKKIQSRGQWPLGTSGELAFVEKQRSIEEFIGRVQAQKMGGKCCDLPLDLTVGSYRLLGTLTNVYERGVVLVRFGKLRGRDLLSGWLHHLVLNRLQPMAETRIVAEESSICFKAEDISQRRPDLDSLLDGFAEGCREPSLLYIEPAFVYARQQANPKAYIPPIDKARQLLVQSLEKGYEPEWQLLLGAQGEKVILGNAFEQLCQEIMCPVWGAADAG